MLINWGNVICVAFYVRIHGDFIVRYLGIFHQQFYPVVVIPVIIGALTDKQYHYPETQD